MKERSLSIERGLRAMHQEHVFKEYRPQFLSEGGDQLVFTIPDHPKSVVKIRKEWVRQMILSPDLHNVSFSDASGEYRDIILAELRDERARFLQFKEYFSDMVLQERFVLMRVPLDKRIVEEVFKNITLSQKTFFDIPVRVQERKDMKKGEFVSLNYGYIDGREDTSLDLFLHSLEPLVSIKKPTRHYPSIAQVLYAMREEFPRTRDLQKTMFQFVERAALYTREADHILDVVGTNNIVLDKNEHEKPRITLLDALCPRSGLTFSGFRAVVKSAGERGLRNRERNDLKNGLHYARFMASLAHEFAPQYVDVFRVPELESQRALVNVYKILCKPSA